MDPDITSAAIVPRVFKLFPNIVLSCSKLVLELFRSCSRLDPDLSVVPDVFRTCYSLVQICIDSGLVPDLVGTCTWLVLELYLQPIAACG